MTTIKIPSTIEEATDKLASLDGLITAREWERAGIVSAFVRKGHAGRPAIGASSLQFTIREFCSRRVPGLSDRRAVSRYLDAWAAAVADGHAVEVEPGTKVKVPDVPWADYFVGSDIAITDAITDAAETEGAGATKVADIVKNKKAMAAAIKADPAVARAALEAVSPSVIAEAVANDPAVARAVLRNPQAREQMEDEDAAAADRHVQTERMHETHRKEDAKRTGIRAIQTMGALASARKKLREALDEAKYVEFNEEETDLINNELSLTHKTLDLLDLRFGGTSGIDWDAELVKLEG